MTLETAPCSSVSSELKLIGGSVMSLILLVALTYWIFFFFFFAWQYLGLKSALVFSDQALSAHLQEGVIGGRKREALSPVPGSTGQRANSTGQGPYLCGDDNSRSEKRERQ